MFEFIAAKKAEHSVKTMCRVVGRVAVGLSRLAEPAEVAAGARMSA